MSRMRDGGGRSRMGSGDYNSRRSYGNQGGSGFGHGGPGLLDSGMMGHGMGGGSGYGMGSGGGYDMDGLLHQRSLQQQLSLRESQLALANSLLQQQQQQSYMMEPPAIGMRGPGPMGMGSMMMNKRRQDMRQGDYMPDYKRPRNDFPSRPRDRYRDRDSEDGNRSSNYRRNQSSSHSSNRNTSGKGTKGSTDKYDPEKPTADDDKEDGDKSKGKWDQFHCHVCNVNCRDAEGFRRHMNSNRHKDRMMGVLAVHEEKSCQIASRMKAEKHLRHLEDEDKIARGYCKICDVSLNMRYSEHQRLTFHRKRVMQVTKGCGWCGVPSFKNFSEVLAHRETEEHQQNQEKHEGKDSKSRKDSEREGTRASAKKRAPIRVEIPADLARYDPDTVYGQMCVVPVSGWFCKLCNKFNNNETAAKETHCKTESHYVKYKRFVYAKLRAKAEAEREAAEKADEEERELAEGQDKKNGTGDKEDEDAEHVDEEEGGEDQEPMEEGGEEEELEAAEEEEGEGEEQDDNAMLAAEGTSMDYGIVDEDEEPDESSLLDDVKDGSAYHTAEDNTVGAETTGDLVEEGDHDVDVSDISLLAGESGSEFLQHSQPSAGEEDTKEEELEGEADVEEEVEEVRPKPRATRAAVSPRSTSTPVSGRGRGGTNKARRGRKMAK